MPVQAEDLPKSHVPKIPRTPANDIIGRMVVGAFPDEARLLSDYGVSSLEQFAQWMLAADHQGWSLEIVKQKIQEAGGQGPDPTLWD